MSILLGYHHEHVVAQNALVEKLPMPPEVMLQDFNERRHSNMLGEARLVGEAALDRTLTMNIGEETMPKWVQIVPFFPVSVEALPTAFQYIEDQTIQAMPHETKQQLAASAWHIRGMQDTPMGMLIIEAGVSIDEAILHNAIGDGGHGPLVAVSGSVVMAGTLYSQAATAFLEAGTEFLPDMPMVLPYPNGVRVTGPVQDYSTWRDVFGWGVIGFTLMAAYCIFGGDLRGAAGQRKRTPAVDPVEPLAPVTNVFADIRTQEELSFEEEQTATPTRRALSRRVRSRMI